MSVSKKFANNVATVFNGNSFVAKSLIARLGRNGCNIVIGYRGSGYAEEKMRIAGNLGQIQKSHYFLKDEDSLRRAMENSDTVINLVGSRCETRNFSFEQVHVEGARRMAKVAREVGVKKFIHMSALNANPNPTPVVLKHGSKFLKSKYYGELAVREEFPEAIIFRPADILGERDSFLNHFTEFWRSKLTAKISLWDYYYQVEKQPVYVDDVAAGIEKAMENDWANGKTIQAVGPYRYDFYDLIEYMRACSGQGQKYDQCEIRNLRWDPIMRFIITFVETLQKYPFITWERVETDSISDFVDPNLPTLKDLGVELTSVEKIIHYLGHYRPRHHRVEIPFHSARQIDLPKKLNLSSS